MKKVVRLFSILIFLFAFTMQVEARVSVIGTKARTKIGYFGGADTWKYNFDVDGTTMEGICHNPGISAYKDSDLVNGRLDFVEIRGLADPVKNTKVQNIFDAGLMSILSKKCGEKDDKCHMEVYIATNLYEQLFPMINTNGKNDSSEIPYLKYIINDKMYSDIEDDLKYLASPEAMGSYNVIKGKFSSSEAVNCSGSSCDSLGAVSNAVNMAKEAVKTAREYATSDEAIVTSSNSIQKRTTSQDGDQKKFVNTVENTINIYSFSTGDRKSGSVKLKYECKNNCSGVSTKFYLNDKEYSASDLQNLNLVDLTEKGSGAIRLKIEFSGNHCNPIDYSLSVTYKHSTVTSYGLSVSKCSNSRKCQGFYIYDQNQEENTKTSSIDNTIQLCTTTTDVNKCVAKIDNVDCIACETTEEQTIEVNEGYKYANDNTCDTSGASLNVKECVANDGAVDTAGNPLKNTELSKDTLYAGAGVYCKEDYELTLPGSKVVPSGYYFILDAAIKGTQYCYTSQLASNSKAKNDIKTAADAQVAAFNELKKAEAIAAALEAKKAPTFILSSSYEKCGSTKMTASNSSICETVDGKMANSSGGYVSCYSCGDEYCYDVAKFNFKPKIIVRTEYTGYDPNSCQPITVSVKETYGEDLPFDPNKCGLYEFREDGQALADSEYTSLIAKIGQQATLSSCKAGGGSSAKGDSTYSCSYKGGSGLKSEIGPGPIISIINKWNIATGFSDAVIGNDFDDTPFDGGWQMNYNFNPEMHFWYQEEYMTDENGRLIQDTMEETDKYLNDVDTSYCTGDVNESYETCTNGWKKEITKSEVDEGTACVCNLKSCTSKKYVLSKVKYVKKEQTAGKSFITPTQFYNTFPTGSASLMSRAKDEEIPSSSVIKNGLPVGLGTVGTRNYILWAKNLGEYFDTGNLGRVWGENNSVIPKILNDRQSCENPNAALVYENNTDNIIHGDGVYVCKYSTLCRERCKKPEESRDNKWHCLNTPDNECNEEKYNEECCPDCPKSFKCTPSLDEKGNIMYYLDDGSSTYDKSLYKAKCCKDGDCPPICYPCIFEDGLLVDYRQVTSENLNPNDRKLGANWYWNDVIDSAIELKAFVTTKEIEENGESIFDVDFSNQNDDNEFAMQVVMDSTMINAIRKLNKDEKYKNYTANTMDCYDYKNGDVVYKNIYCYSTFIDELLKKEGAAERIKFSKTRPSSKELRTPENNSKYFKTWIDADGNMIESKLDKWHVETEQQLLAYYQKNYGKVYDEETKKETDYFVGPSWK